MITDTHHVLVGTWPQQTLGFIFSLPAQAMAGPGMGQSKASCNPSCSIVCRWEASVPTVNVRTWKDQTLVSSFLPQSH